MQRKAKITVGMLLVLTGLVWIGNWSPAEPLPGPQMSGGLHSHFSQQPGEPKTLVLVDPQTRVVGVYQINSDSEIELKSVRNVTWDLRMTGWNTAKPTPEEIREAQPR